MKAQAKNETTNNLPAQPWTPVMAIPAAAANDVGLGNENVRPEDQMIPRLSLLQAMSPEVTMGHEKFIDGAHPGLLCNSLTDELYSAVYCANLNFKVEFVVWRKREIGGGLYGSFNTEQEAVEALNADPDVKDANHYDVQETHTHALLLLDENGQPTTPILCSMAVSKLKVSRQWNSMPQLREASRFASIWALSGKPVAGPQGTYFNLSVEFAGFASDELYASIKKTYTDLGFDKH